MTAHYPLQTLRTLALHRQALTTPNGAEPEATKQAIHEMVERLRYVQIDTLHMVHRAQYLTLWSRFGTYSTQHFDDLIFNDDERQLFEYWGHAASIIPLRDYRYSYRNMLRARAHPDRWYEKWLTETVNQKVVEEVKGRITAEGALRAADFEHKKDPGSWWNWKPAKRALEYLFSTGDLMITRRVNFQRYYDLTERVLPQWVDTKAPTTEEVIAYYVEESLKALGVCRPAQVAEYAYMKRGTAKPAVEKLIENGTAHRITGTTHSGEEAEFIVHHDNLPLLDQIAEGQITAQRTTFLNPFDSLWWARGRDEDLWGFVQRLEAYKKAEDRIWGYYTLPILHKDRLIGRFDPKLDRKKDILYLRALYLQDSIDLSDELIADVATAMRDFMTFHNAEELVIEKSTPAEFGERLLKAL